MRQHQARGGKRSTLLASGLLALLLGLSSCGLGGNVPGGNQDSAAQDAAGSGGNASSTVPSQTGLSALKLLPDPKAYRGSSKARLADPSVVPVAENPQPTLPATVASRDRDGDFPVTVDNIDRVVAFDLAGSIAGTVYGLGLGAKLVGRDVATTLPRAADLPLVTSPNGQSVNAESMLALKPSLVLTDGTVGPLDVITQLRQSGIPVVFVKNAPSFAGAQELSRQVGAALGVPEAGAALADQLAASVSHKVAEIAEIAPKVPAQKLRMVFLYLRGGSGVYYLFGAGSGADALISGLAGVDVAAEIGWRGMKPMTDEALAEMNPDLVLVMSGGIESVGGVDGLLAQKPALALSNAGKNRRFIEMADGEILSFGPRSAEILDALARAVYAPQP